MRLSRWAWVSLVGLSLLLTACGGDDSAATPPALPTQPAVSGSNITTGTGTTGANNNASSGGTTGGSTGGTPASTRKGPLVGPDGQITVVAPPPNGQNINGQIFWVKENNIWEGGAGTPGGAPLTIKDLGGKQLTQATDLALAVSPAISPDGTQMAYAYSPEPTGTQANIVIGQDLYLFDLKSGANALLVARDDPQGFLDDPAWSADGKYVYYDSRVPRRDETNTIVGESLTLYRYNLATKQRDKLTNDAREASPFPDGKHVAFTQVNMEGDYTQQLGVLDLDTLQTHIIAGTAQNFLAIYHPEISPDGQTIAFAGAGGPGSGLTNASGGALPLSPPTPTKSGSLLGGAMGLLSVLPHPRATANQPPLHGFPYDLWTVKPDGSGLHQLTNLYEDQPMAAWSKDGKKIAFLAGQGFYIIDADGQNLIKRSSQGAHGGFAWVDK